MSVPTSSLLVERDDSLPLVHVAASTLSGAAVDDVSLSGLSRLATRLARRTAGGQPTEAIDEQLEALGGAMGVDCGHESISLSGTVLARNFEPFMDLLSSMICSPGLSPDELERLERETLAERLEVLDSDQQLAQRWFARSVFTEHPYGRSVVGTRETLARASVSHVEATLRRHFRAENLLFSFAGDVDVRAAERWAQSIRRGVGSLGESLPGAVGEPRARAGRHLVFVDKPERTQTQILIGGLGGHPRDEDYFDLMVATTAFGGTFTSRLSQEIRAKRGWSYGAYSSLGSW